MVFYYYIPGFLVIKHHITSQPAKRMLRKASTALSREKIHDTRTQLNHTEDKLYRVHCELSTRMDHVTWETVDDEEGNQDRLQRENNTN